MSGDLTSKLDAATTAKAQLELELEELRLKLETAESALGPERQHELLNLLHTLRLLDDKHAHTADQKLAKAIQVYGILRLR